MDTRHSHTAQATASGVPDAPALVNQGVGEKSATGQIKRQITPKVIMNIAAWNVRTGYHAGQKELIAQELLKCKIAIAALSEVRMTGSGTTTIISPRDNGKMVLYYSGGVKHEAGVGFMVNKQITGSVIGFQPISDRLAVLTVAGTITTHIISAYAPTEISSDTAKDGFYDQLQQVLDSIPKTDVVVLAGDFNAHVGSERAGWEATLGKFSHGTVNDNGLRLLTFAATNNLVLGNTFFQHPLKHRLTWKNSSGKDTAMLDYILINARFRSSLQDVRSMRGPDCGSDHYLIRGRIRLKLARRKKTLQVTTRLDWTQLSSVNRQHEFQLALANRFHALTASNDVNEEERRIAETILECATPLCQTAQRRTQPWISNECLNLVAQRKQAKLVNFERYRQLNREVRRKLKEEREKYWNQMASELEAAACKHEYRTLYRTLRGLRGKCSSVNDNIKKPDGTFVRSTPERLQRWKDFFEELYNHEVPRGPPVNPPEVEVPSSRMNEDEPTIEEIREAVAMLKNGKAPGIDEITSEAMKAGGTVLLERLHALICMIWRSDNIPSRWKKAIIIPIHKKGDNHECRNYRGISLLSIVGKTFMKVIQRRLQIYREQTSREEQSGFRPGRGCCDQIFALRQLMEERIRCGQRTIVIFIDFKSAFDCIDWNALWFTLEAEHVPRKIVALLKAAYDGSTSSVKIRQEFSSEFTITTGVRQGDVVSPLLFNIVVDAIMRKVFNGRLGVRFGAEHYLTDLMFADDSAIFANDDAEATDILCEVARSALPYGLKINAEKTKVLTTDGSMSTIHLEGSQIEQVEEFKYLGSLIQQRKVTATSEVHSRMGQATWAFSSLRWCVWNKPNISLKTKIRLYRTLVVPILLYGSETWTLLQHDMNKLETFQMRCLRTILRISLRDHRTNASIREQCDHQPTLAEHLRKRRLRWFGHVCRMGSHRLPYRLLWRTRPDGWRIRPEAPKKTWAKEIEVDLRPCRLDLERARNIAGDRGTWKEVCDGTYYPVAPTAAYWLRGHPYPGAS